MNTLFRLMIGLSLLAGAVSSVAMEMDKATQKLPLFLNPSVNVKIDQVALPSFFASLQTMKEDGLKLKWHGLNVPKKPFLQRFLGQLPEDAPLYAAGVGTGIVTVTGVVALSIVDRRCRKDDGFTIPQLAMYFVGTSALIVGPLLWLHERFCNVHYERNQTKVAAINVLLENAENPEWLEGENLEKIDLTGEGKSIASNLCTTRLDLIEGLAYNKNKYKTYDWLSREFHSWLPVLTMCGALFIDFKYDLSNKLFEPSLPDPE